MGHDLNLVEAILLFSIAIWVFGLGFAFIVQHQNQFMNWTGRTLSTFFRNYWRYIAVFALGYFLAQGNIVHLSTSF